MQNKYLQKTSKDKGMSENIKLSDSSLMPWGKHKGIKMANVPASYLLWLYENDKCDNLVKNYIRDNLDVLKQEK